MTLISASNLGKEFAGQVCFRRADCSLQAGDRVGLIGQNGTGKSTLLRIIQGTLEHEGTVSRRRGLRIALLDQEPDLPEGLSVRKAVLSGHERACELLRQRAQVHEALARPGLAGEETERLLKRLSTIDAEAEREGADLLDQRVERILDGIGFPRGRIDEPVDDLSGGERNRVALGRLLLTDPDVFLLDEPTNHLDLDGIAFLTKFLQETSAGVILVSHDRRFLDETTTQTWHLEGERLWIYPAPYSRAKVLREERLANERQAFERQQEFLQKQEQFIRRYKAGQRARQAKGRLRRLERVERLQRPEEQVRSMILRLPMKTPPGANVVELEEVTMGFGDRVLFRDLSVEIQAGETLGIVGANGTGKTTLLRLLTGELEPLSGRSRWGGRVERGVLSQHEVFPDPDMTPFGYLHACHPKLTIQELRDLLGAMLFRGNEIDKPVHVLSGGEQKRLMLTRLILEGNNVLLLDEPTNHLDLQSRDAVELALSNYEGSMIVVSHDRYFLDLIADRILWIEPDGWHQTWGGYREAEAARWKRRQAAVPPPTRKESRKTSKTRSSKKPKSPFSHLKTEVLEAKIIELEERLYALQMKLGDQGVAPDAAKRKEVEEKIASIDQEKAALEEEYGNRES